MRIGPARSRLAAAAAFLALTLITACQDAGNGTDDEPGAAGAQPTSDSKGEPDERSGAVDPCTLLDPSDYRQWSPTPRVARRHLLGGSASWAACLI
ncbi:hypothetical protein, partial [Nocardioides sp.]|uniref:hypothetical protein n=1 Tax=Nocardioides sp. TaxID=35761 RepID=UPI0027369F7A